MSKILFMSYPGYGHINNTLGIVERLVQHNHEIIYASNNQYKKIIEDTGAVFLEYDDKYMDTGLEPTNINNMLYSMESLYFQSKSLVIFQNNIYTFMKEKIKELQPDCIIHDSCAFAAKMIGHELGIPSISCYSNLPVSSQIFEAHQEYFCNNYFKFPEVQLYKNGKGIKRIEKILRRRLAMETGVQLNSFFDLFHANEKLNLIFTTKRFQPFGNEFDDSYHFVGPIIREFYKEEVTIKKENPLIYVSFGTTLLNNFFIMNTLFNALKGTGFQVIVSLGGDVDISGIGEIPENITIQRFVPQKEILKKADLFITCGSTNGTGESLYYHVPLLVIPFALADHFMVAEQVEKLGLGVYIRDLYLSSEELLHNICLVINDPKYKANCVCLGKELANAGGVEKSVCLIESYMKL
ncbi:MAG: hypothetical protein K2M60_09210 [Lachnospiraceae bacterium]|nr:hypothetical protein [Lachnospiraceae bacterium]MDE6252904.1 hypothetical protein [Lachnospiraceae bacterium]